MNENLNYYEKVGLKVGLEVHQQINTKQKLFCKCPTIMVENGNFKTIKRFLRPSKSELGEVDPAALFEYMKHKEYIYEIPEEASCLVELDEEPPHELNQEALEVALMVALMLKSNPVDEVHVMRKVVIDGSNTTGFQRTAIIAMGGYVNDEEGNVEIKTLCLEEEAARKIAETEDKVIYRLDRLGIPLIEIATAPTIKTPQQARRVALRIGRILRATGMVKRGLGTIRQDLNISISNGARVEIKGVQDLNLIPKIVEYEVQRQLKLLEIRDELIRRGVKAEELESQIIDITEILKESKSKLIRKTVMEGGGVYAVKLRKFKGLLGMEIQPNRRFGTELSERAKLMGGVEGIIHSDELPGYGISQEDLNKIMKYMDVKDEDAIVIVCGKYENCKRALEAVVQRAREALIGVPEETRAANDDGTTRYSRPMPGAARMYPETDIRPIPITEDMLNKIKSKLPEDPEETIRRYIVKYGLSRKLAEELIDSDRGKLFEEIVAKWSENATLIASTITYTINSLKNKGLPVENIKEESLKKIFDLISRGEMAKEAIPEVLEYITVNPNVDVEEAVKILGKGGISIEELEKIVREEIDKAKDVIRERGMKAMGLLMGRIMGIVRGRIDGKIVNETVKRMLEEELKSLKQS